MIDFLLSEYFNYQLILFSLLKFLFELIFLKKYRAKKKREIQFT